MKITITPITESKRILDKCRLTVNKEPSKNPRPVSNGGCSERESVWRKEWPVTGKVVSSIVKTSPWESASRVNRHQDIES